jgi:hypothetical protein
MNVKPGMFFVDATRRLTAEAFNALQASKDNYQLLKIPTGPVSTDVNVVLQLQFPGFVVVTTNGVVIGLITVTRGAVSLSTGGGTPFPVSPGDVLKFTYNTPLLSIVPTVHFLPR